MGFFFFTSSIAQLTVGEWLIGYSWNWVWWLDRTRISIHIAHSVKCFFLGLRNSGVFWPVNGPAWKSATNFRNEIKERSKSWFWLYWMRRCGGDTQFYSFYSTKITKLHENQFFFSLSFNRSQHQHHASKAVCSFDFNWIWDIGMEITTPVFFFSKLLLIFFSFMQIIFYSLRFHVVRPWPWVHCIIIHLHKNLIFNDK